MNIAAAFVEHNIPGVSPGIYSDADFRAIAALIYAESGNVLPPAKVMLVYSRLAPLLRETRCATFAEYVALIQSDAVQRRNAVDALTTNHTFFFREDHHFQHFDLSVRPTLVKRLIAGERVRMWSAGCSSGEETWSLVMTLLGEDRVRGRDLAQRNVRVLASDLCRDVLRRAESAVYSQAEIAAVPEGLRRVWMTGDDASVTVSGDARALVRFRELNLMGDWPMRHPFDVIFCRNVMIYFDQATKNVLVERLARQLRPGGYLYIGHSERAAGPGGRLLEPVGPTIYRRRG